MSPTTPNGRFGSSPSSTGTIPKANSRFSVSSSSNFPENSGGVPENPAVILRRQTRNLERLLREQQTNLRCFDEFDSSPGRFSEDLAGLSEKLRLLRTLNNSAIPDHPADPDLRNRHFPELKDIMPTHVDEVLDGDDDEEVELLTAMQEQRRIQRELQNRWRIYEAGAAKKQRKNQTATNQLTLNQENERLQKTLQNQQEQITQLTQSLNQCFQVLLTMQRDVAVLQQNMAAKQESQNGGPPVFQTASAWDFDFDNRAQDSWNNFLASVPGPVRNAAGPETDTGYGRDSAALNNQVPPGIRANNYWDNFRSFSRQNRLSSTNMGGYNPVVAQVTPRQVVGVRQNVNNNNNSNNSNNNNNNNNVEIVEPFFSNSPPRPRRKQKINREQNVSSHDSRPLEAAMVFPMPQQHPSGMSADPMASSIKRSIYSHLNELIAQNEGQPDQLARLFHEIQQMRRSGPRDEPAENNSESAQQQPRWHNTMYDATTSDEETFKVANNGNKSNEQRFATVESSIDSNEANDDDRLFNYFRIGSPQSGLSDSLASLGAVGGGIEPVVVDQADSGAKKQNVVAVPKNVQRNLISRERDGRIRGRVSVLAPKVLPRNMVGDPDQPAGESFQLSFKNSVVVDPGSNPPRDQGLDRVPTRLSSSELDAGRQEEEDSLQNLVDEVLNTSAEASDFVDNNRDMASDAEER